MEKELIQAKLRQSYFIVLIIMITTTTLSSIVAVNFMIEQEHDSRNINISGMQRMLSQKIALHAEQISNTNYDQVEYARKRMLASAIRFLENHKLLVSEHNNPNLSDQIAQKYFAPENNLDKAFRQFANRAIAYSNGAQYDQPWPYDSRDIENILLELDTMVTLFEEAASQNVGNIFFIELAIWLVNLIIIVAAYFVLVKRAFLN